LVLAVSILTLLNTLRDYMSKTRGEGAATAAATLLTPP
jgi:hypothetical protein